VEVADIEQIKNLRDHQPIPTFACLSEGASFTPSPVSLSFLTKPITAFTITTARITAASTAERLCQAVAPPVDMY
jgi:hypothetical protein